MPSPSKVELLPEGVRHELEKRLVARAFSDYEGLSAWLEELGHAVSKSALHRYGAALERELLVKRERERESRLVAKQTARPSKGRVIIIKGAVWRAGDDEHAAIITRVCSPGPGTHGEWAVNATMFPDGDTPRCVTSVALFPDRATALEYQLRCLAHGSVKAPHVAFWPERV